MTHRDQGSTIGTLFQIVGPPTEKERRCVIAVRERGTMNSCKHKDKHKDKEGSEGRVKGKREGWAKNGTEDCA